jgi:ABC-type multidrug transport system fused ATPase/permease subunit
MSMPATRYRDLLITYLKPQWPQVGLLAGLLLGGIALQLINPQLLRAFIDRAMAGSPLDALLAIAALFLGLAVLTQAVTVAETYVANNVGWNATNRLRGDLALHCLRLDPSFHSTQTPGALIERIDGDVAALGNFFSRFVVQVLGNALLLLGVLALLFRIDTRVGLALTAFTAVSLAITGRLRNLATPRWAAARQASADLFGFLEERLSGTEDIRAIGAPTYVMRRLHERARTLLHRQVAASVLGATTGATGALLLTLGTALSITLGVFLFEQGTITIGTVFLIFIYTQLLNRPVEEITRQLQDLQQAGASVARIHDLLGIRSTIVDGPGVDFPPGALAVEFDRVSFGYVPAAPVLRDLSFALPPGTVLGLLGRTGSGKSTLARLLFRLHDPTAGAVLLGGHDLRAARVDDVRRRVGMVTQDIQLFHATVRDNLTFFDDGVPDERILAVLADVGLWDWYRALPLGLQTKLAPGGSGLSAGEAQLLAFARVFLKDPSLVILDEASSRLDPATERRVEHAVERLLQERTAIIIAHRLATVGRAERIMILDEGRIAEYGERALLAADDGSRFAALLRTGLEEALA